MTRADAVARVAAALGRDALAVACNGMIGRELFTRADAPTRFYMIGSMGLAASIGLGLALVQPSRTIVVFDGDGNVLMNLGTADYDGLQTQVSYRGSSKFQAAISYTLAKATPPSARSTACRRAAPTARIVACGGLMMAANSRTPYMPRLEIAEEPP